MLKLHEEAQQPPHYHRVPFELGAPNAARVWSALIGPKDTFQHDRDTAEMLRATYPDLRQLALTHRFLHDSLVYNTADAVTSFVDLGAGLPPNPSRSQRLVDRTTEESAGRYAAGGSIRVVTVDHDEVAALYNAALRSGTVALHADVRDTHTVLTTCDEHLGDEPRAYVMTALAELLTADDLGALVSDLVQGSPPGSLLATSHTDDTPETAALAAAWKDAVPGSEMFPRTSDRLAALLDASGVKESRTYKPQPMLPGKLRRGPVYATIATL
ncbi:SAM-dependent methyltransferase [Conexibacter stalactiti]|uniref:SAM-dependent methyltransferase n=1 Tax=Conexibacter stalactiti TaxID=1940611 RepID=A0ABU4HX47_9ACTN|nr:SAM-dependent methyltransferase [Conexibacter stalactiti]MDW5597434.1 SAM-dependent methyltransferase [Conexibacter stalactiti]MEC5038076.1 SAM-dependent methyltransferase [Conexibacter stalactiti]